MLYCNTSFVIISIFIFLCIFIPLGPLDPRRSYLFLSFIFLFFTFLEYRPRSQSYFFFLFTFFEYRPRGRSHLLLYFQFFSFFFIIFSILFLISDSSSDPHSRSTRLENSNLFKFHKSTLPRGFDLVLAHTLYSYTIHAFERI